jgi:DNA modification methylase
MGTAGMVWLMRALACEAASVLVEGGSLLVFCDWRMIINLAPAMESSGLRYQNMIVWNKNGAGLGTGFRPQHELIMHFVKGTGVFHALTGTNVVTTARVRSDDKDHPTEKPVALIEQLIRVVSPHDGLIVDPFAGSGTTLVAARNLGRRYIGSDLSEEYCEVTRRRLAEPFTPTLFALPKPDAQTLPMFVGESESAS